MIELPHSSENCANIGVEGADSPLAAEIEEDLKKVEAAWMQLEEFKEGLGEFEEEDWIVFRTRPQRLEDFLVKWESQFKNQAKSDVVIRILKDVDGYKVLRLNIPEILHCLPFLILTDGFQGFLPNMKYIRGDSFTEKHWYELFSILKMPSKQLGELKVKDFLKVRHTIEERLKDIQVNHILKDMQ